LNGRAPLRALVICGPTASGKSSIAVAVAKRLGGEIVNADSRQIYRGMEIGTGVPTEEQRAQVSHHLYAFLDPAERYSAARYVADASATIEAISARGKLPIVVGGTGFYVEALIGTMPLDRPPPDDALRDRLRREALVHPADVLWEWLFVRAPQIASQTKQRDRYRVIRGLERALAQPASGENGAVRIGVEATIVRLFLSKQALTGRIGQRVRQMFREGIVAEASVVRAAAPDAPALTGLGYAEALAMWDGLASEDEAMARTVKRTVQYAKRQETWFRRLRCAAVIDATDERSACDRIAKLAKRASSDGGSHEAKGS
jgi:tRNA dimethylallyltransferase